MKRIFTLLAVFALTMTAMAQEAALKVDGRDGTILSFQMDNTIDIYGVGFKFKLPEGVTVKTKYNEDDDEDVPQIKKNTTRAKGGTYKLYIDNIPGGGYSINMVGTESPFTGSEGEIISVELDGTLNGQVRIYDINFSDADKNSYYMNGDNTTEITVDLKADAINSISAEQTKSGAIYNLSGQRVSKATKGIFIVDGKKVAVQ
jgi:hypothetical protein